MRRVAAPLAAVLCAMALAGCGGGGAEPGAPKGATLVLDFQPNAVHSGIYAAQAKGFFEDEGLDVTIREPSSSSDAPKLLAAGRADFAVMDINDFGIAREQGADIAAIAAIVQRPLASVIAGDRIAVKTPADLAGKTVGVTGVPSDDAVLDTILDAGGVNPGSVKRITIGFKAVPTLAARRIDAATAFWNAEGVELQQLGVASREFRVDEFGAPRYPELVLAASEDAARASETDPGRQVCQLLRGLERGYIELGNDANAALDDLLEEVPDADRDSQSAQLAALVAASAFSRSGKIAATASLDPGAVRAWQRWAISGHVLSSGSGVAAGFRPDELESCVKEAG